MSWDEFFPPGTRVLALPSWRRPRLYLPACPLSQRWNRSKLYPASRWSARLYRLSLRAAAAAGMKRARTAGSRRWSLGDFAEDHGPAEGRQGQGTRVPQIRRDGGGQQEAPARVQYALRAARRGRSTADEVRTNG